MLILVILKYSAIVLQKYGVIIRAMVVMATRCRRTHQTRTSPLVRVQLFQKLGGWMLFVILKISHILCFYIHGSILYLHFCYTLYIYIYLYTHTCIHFPFTKQLLRSIFNFEPYSVQCRYVEFSDAI